MPNISNNTSENDSKRRQTALLDSMLTNGLIVNDSGDIKARNVVIRGSESKLVNDMITLSVSQGDIPVGVDERLGLVKTAQRIVRKLGVDR